MGGFLFVVGTLTVMGMSGILALGWVQTDGYRGDSWLPYVLLAGVIVLCAAFGVFLLAPAFRPGGT